MAKNRGNFAGRGQHLRNARESEEGRKEFRQAPMTRTIGDGQTLKLRSGQTRGGGDASREKIRNLPVPCEQPDGRPSQQFPERSNCAVDIHIRESRNNISLAWAPALPPRAAVSHPMWWHRLPFRTWCKVLPVRKLLLQSSIECRPRVTNTGFQHSGLANCALLSIGN